MRMSTMQKDVISLETEFPIGKYRGVPLELVFQDRDYMRWMMSQAGLAAKYKAIIDFYRNGGVNESSFTPEHNAMQLRFLDPAYTRKFVSSLRPEMDQALCSCGHTFPWKKQTSFKTNFEVNGWDVRIFRDREYTYCPMWEKAKRLKRHNVDTDTLEVLLELKPSVGDDFPQIFRQMGSAFDRFCKFQVTNAESLMVYLVTERLDTTNATEQQVRAFFGTGNFGFKILSDDEL